MADRAAAITILSLPLSLPLSLSSVDTFWALWVSSAFRAGFCFLACLCFYEETGRPISPLTRVHFPPPTRFGFAASKSKNFRFSEKASLTQMKKKKQENRGTQEKAKKQI